MITVLKGDILELHSENGLIYKVEILNINEYRPPEMKYACNIIDPNGNSYFSTYGDYYFCGDDFIQKLEKK